MMKSMLMTKSMLVTKTMLMMLMLVLVISTFQQEVCWAARCWETSSNLASRFLSRLTWETNHQLFRFLGPIKIYHRVVGSEVHPNVRPSFLSRKNISSLTIFLPTHLLQEEDVEERVK